MQLSEHLANVFFGLESDHQVHEILALEAHRGVAVRARAAQARIASREHVERAAQVRNRIDVAAGRDEDLGHVVARAGA